MKLLSVLFVCAMAITSQDVWAKRLGGGASVGKQSANVTQRNTPAAAPQAPAQGAAATKPTAAAPAAAPQRLWGTMLGGLAAGLGLAWLASTLGFGEAFAQFLLVALLGVVAVMVVGWVLRSRAQSRAAQVGGANLAFQSADATTPRGYSPQNVGNDASARPWERSTMGFDTGSPALAGGALIGTALNSAQNWSIPADFDVDGFLSASKANFVNLQAAWDRSDIPSLRAMMTDEMLAQIKSQLAEREQHTGGAPNQTEVVMLEAHLLGIEELEQGYMASVEFSGLIREDVSTGPNPFREVWNITRPKAGKGGWLVAGVQALQ
ncbi:Tim44 domain-containing protein [Hydrogenophaga defluvii]|uniref:Tim44 domain-containing protein n=1 Tax=Hydrogenophaga defluvii TaxID=249410 RepID=A0ABW2S6X9_9BURK